jgi:uncharacterized phiE125 gp8 family phage protein
MPRVLMNQPLVEPLGLAEAKQWLRIDHTADDGLIAAIIVGVRQRLEGRTGRAFVNQGWRIILDAWPAGGEVPLLPPPVGAVTAVRVIAASGEITLLPAESYRLEARREPGLLIFGSAPPVPGRTRAGIEIDITCGYGPAATDCPGPLRQAMRLLVAHVFENRGNAASPSREPAEVNALIAPYRLPRLGGRS